MDYNALKNKMKGEAFAEQEDKFYEMTGKGKLAGMGKEKSPGSPFGPVSNAPSKTVTGAKQETSPSGKTFTGKGGYEYGANADGSFMILKSGRGAAPGTVVKEGMKGYDAIKQEFEGAKASRPASASAKGGLTKVTPMGMKGTKKGGVAVTNIGFAKK